MKENEKRHCPKCSKLLTLINLDDIRDMGRGSAYICVPCKEVIYKIESMGGTRKVAPVEDLGILKAG